MKIERDKKYNTRGGRVVVAAFFDEKRSVALSFPWLMVNDYGEAFWVNREGCHIDDDRLDLISEHREAREWDAWVDDNGELQTYQGGLGKGLWPTVRVREVLDGG